jgi:hypothetical protein
MGIGEPRGSLVYLCADDRWTTPSGAVSRADPSPGLLAASALELIPRQPTGQV